MVTFENVRESKSVRRWVEKKIARWIQSHTLTVAAAQPSFDASFWREGDQNWISCVVRVNSGRRILKGHWYGRSVQQALQECLGHLG